MRGIGKGERKTMKNAIDAVGHQTHLMSVVGHDTKTCHAQKK